MKQIVIFPRGQLTPKDKERMSKLGVVAVEADDPSKVVMVTPAEGISADMLSMAALDAMAGPCESSTRARFAENLHKSIKERRAALSLQNVSDDQRSAERK